MSQLQIRRKPENQPATARQIKQKRDAMESAPVQVEFGGRTLLVDCDSLSIERLAQAVDNWVHLRMMKNNGALRWTMADNSVVEFSQGEFAQFVTAVKRAKASRRDRLFFRAQQLVGQLPSVTAGMIEDSQWN